MVYELRYCHSGVFIMSVSPNMGHCVPWCTEQAQCLNLKVRLANMGQLDLMKYSDK